MNWRILVNLFKLIVAIKVTLICKRREIAAFLHPLHAVSFNTVYHTWPWSYGGDCQVTYGICYYKKPHKSPVVVPAAGLLLANIYILIPRIYKC